MAKKMVCLGYSKSQETGKCKYYRKGGWCVLAGRIRCLEWLIRNQHETTIEELVSHPEFARIDRDIETKNRSGNIVRIKADCIADFAGDLLRSLNWLYSFSQTWGCYNQCRFQWFLRYLKCVEPIEQAHYLLCGSFGHELLEGINKRKPFKEVMDLLRVYEAKRCSDKHYVKRLRTIRAIARIYYKHDMHKFFVGVENHVKSPLLPLHAYFDGTEFIECDLGLSTARRIQSIAEHKFTAATEFKLEWEYQGRFYMCLSPDSDEVHFNLFRKPNMNSFNIHKGESLPEYEKRIYTAMLNNWDRWYASETIKRNRGKDQNVLDGTVFMISELERARKLQFPVRHFPKNIKACKLGFIECPYKSLCETDRFDPGKYTVGPRIRDDDDEEEEDVEE